MVRASVTARAQEPPLRRPRRSSPLSRSPGTRTRPTSRSSRTRSQSSSLLPSLRLERRRLQPLPPPQTQQQLHRAPTRSGKHARRLSVRARPQYRRRSCFIAPTSRGDAPRRRRSGERRPTQRLRHRRAIAVVCDSILTHFLHLSLNSAVAARSLTPPRLAHPQISITARRRRPPPSQRRSSAAAGRPSPAKRSSSPLPPPSPPPWRPPSHPSASRSAQSATRCPASRQRRSRCRRPPRARSHRTRCGLRTGFRPGGARSRLFGGRRSRRAERCRWAERGCGGPSSECQI